MALSQTLQSPLAQALAKRGRGKDSLVAHINLKEASLLKALGGRGSVNPKTGLLEFDDAGDPYDYTPPAPQPVFGDSSGGGGGGDTSAAPAPDVSTPASTPDASVAPQQDNSNSNFINPLDFFGGGNASGGGGNTTAPSAPAATSYSPAFSDASQLVGVSPNTNFAGADTGAQAVGDVIGGGGDSNQQSWGGKLASSLSNPTNLTKLLGGLGTAAVGLYSSNKAAKQGQQQAQQITNLGAPFQQQGNNYLNSAEGGALTPGNAQTYQIAQARLAQDAQNRGGVGAQQNIAQAEALRQQLLQNQFTAGLNLVQVGNEYTMAGIKTAMQSDQQVNQSTQNFYQALFKSLGSVQ